ncbi:TPA_asm: RNA-directed RNA polymerase, partial [ssRNA phage Gerhypos.4_47]
MRRNESYAEFILGLYEAQLKDCVSQYPGLAKEFLRDKTRLSSAIEHNGLHFFMEIMPAWRKHFDQCLAAGRLTRTGLIHFGSYKSEGAVPKLFRGLTLRVFNLNGELKPDPDPNAIRWIRQLLGVVKRLRMECGPSDRSDAVKEFLRTDQEVRTGTLDWDSGDDLDTGKLRDISFTDDTPTPSESKQGLLPCFSVSSLPYRHAECIQQVADYISSCLGEYNPTETRFRHGPGAVSDQKFEAYKYAFKNWPDRLDKVFPMADFAVANYANWEDSSLYKCTDAEVRKEFPAKLIAVPKSLSTPRLIASEPTALQWCQQSVRDHLYSRVRRTPLGNFVDFTRQDANGNLALEASRTGEHCTIDLSSASDRISCWFVERLFRRSPDLLAALRATRSKFIVQDICRDSPRYNKLRKYSTMGNATTFPVQSLAFLAICLGTVLYVRNQRFSQSWLKSLGKGTVRVFGDDLIVPKDCSGSVVDALHALGLRVNPAKTFLTGLFRESCGVDAYAGHDVTTTSILDVPIRAKPGSIVSSVDVHNNLVRKGYYNTAAFVQKTVMRCGFDKIRNVTHGSGSFGWFDNYVSATTVLETRRCRDTQVIQVRCMVVKTKQRRNQPECSAGLLQFFTEAARVVETSISGIGSPTQRVKAKLSFD